MPFLYLLSHFIVLLSHEVQTCFIFAICSRLILNTWSHSLLFPSTRNMDM